MIYASHNFETEWYQGQLRRYPFRAFHERSLFELEKRAVDRADHVIAVTPEDKEKMISRLGADGDKITVIPNGYDDTTITPVRREERIAVRRALGLPERGTIALFCGSAVPPNMDAAESITGVIARRAPKGVTFLIAGGVGEAMPSKMPDNCVVTGRVRRMTPFLRAADIGLNPVRLGSGSNIKVLQYIGSGLPVLSTPFGMRGFEDLAPFVTIKRIDLFHRHLTERSLAPEAVELVQHRYAWRRAALRLATLYDRLLEKGR